MNIFATNKCPKISAQYLDTKRVISQIKESAQMLCTALYISSPDSFLVVDYTPLTSKSRKSKKAYYLGNTRIYAPTHKNHPSNVWARQTRENYVWLLRHFKALSDEYTKRRGKVHKSYKELYMVLLSASNLIPQGSLTEFANCAANQEKGVNCKHIKDVHKAYRIYLQERWKNDKITPVWS